MPAQMRVIEITRPGGPEVLQPAVRPVPQPASGEVLIRVAAAGVNRPDVFQRLGSYPPPKGASDLPGLEVAGEIVGTAPDADLWKVGDRVCALVPGGGYAEFCTTPAVQCLPIPASMSLETAATLPETFFTVYSNVFDRAGLTAGETLLVHGGSSGIGTTAILLGKAFGATVIVTAGSAAKCDACLKLGADHAINYRETDFVPAVLEATSGKGADVILDMVGGDYLPRNIAAAAVEGRITQIATLGGAKAELNLRDLMAKRLRIMGSTLRPQPVAAKGRIAQALRTRVWPLFESGRLSPPPLYARFPLAEAHRAHALMESGEHVGKIVLMR